MDEISISTDIIVYSLSFSLSSLLLLSCHLGLPVSSIQSRPWSPPTPTPPWPRMARRRRWAASLTERSPLWCAGRKRNASSTPRPADTWSPSKKWLTKSFPRWWWVLNFHHESKRHRESNFFPVVLIYSDRWEAERKSWGGRAEEILAEIHIHK